MQPKHFIDTLIEAYERAWSIINDPNLHAGFKPGLADVGIWAADQVATNNWHGQAERAGAVGAALLRVRYPETANEESMGLHAFVRLGMAMAQVVGDPPVREALAAAQSAPPPPG